MNRKTILALALASVFAAPISTAYAEGDEEKKPDTQLIADSHEETKPDTQLIADGHAEPGPEAPKPELIA